MASVNIDIDLDEVVSEAESLVRDNLAQDVESVVHEVLAEHTQRDDHTTRNEDLERTVGILVTNLERYRSTLLAIGIMDQPPKEDA